MSEWIEIEVSPIHHSRYHPYSHVDVFWRDNGRIIGRRDGVDISELPYYRRQLKLREFSEFY